MKKVVLLLSIFFLVVSCSTSSDGTGNTGISTNPNFVKGTIQTSDSKTLAGMVVELQNSNGSLKDETDKEGYFEIAVVANEDYAMTIAYNDSLLYSSNSIKDFLSDSSLIISLDVSEEEVENILHIDSTSNDSLEEDEEETDVTPDDTSSTTDATPADDEPSATTPYILTCDSNNFDDSFILMDNDVVLYATHGTFPYAQLGYNIADEDDNVFMAKINNLESYYDSNYTKVEIEFNLDSSESNIAFDTLKAYQILVSWEESEMTNEQRSNDEMWSDGEFLNNGTDAASEPFYADDISNNLGTNTLTIDITEAYKSWKDGAENHGFMLRFATETRSADTCLMHIETSESDNYPIVRFSK